MTIIPHAMVGAALGRLFFRKRYLAFLAGITSHILLDAVPHWDYLTVKAGTINTALAVTGIAFFALRFKDPYLFWGGAGAMIPDLEVAAKALGLSNYPLYFPTHSGAIPHVQVSPWWGIPVQVLLSLACILLIFKNEKLGLARKRTKSQSALLR